MLGLWRNPIQCGSVDFQELLSQQDALFTRDQAYGCGISRHILRYQSGRGRRWQKVLPEVYAAFTGPLSAHQRRRAGVLYAGPDALLAKQTGLLLHGFRRRGDGSLVTVLVPRECGVRSTAFVTVTRSWRRDPGCIRSGLPVCTAARAVVDTARELRKNDVRALLSEAVQRRITTVDALAREVAAAPRCPTELRLLIEALRAGARSAPEIELLDLARRASLPEPLCNQDLIVDGEWLARPDSRWGWVIVEVDSREWHSDVESWQRTLERHNLLTQLGFVVLHVTPRQIARDPERVIALIRDALVSAGELEA